MWRRCIMLGKTGFGERKFNRDNKALTVDPRLCPSFKQTWWSPKVMLFQCVTFRKWSDLRDYPHQLVPEWRKPEGDFWELFSCKDRLETVFFYLQITLCKVFCYCGPSELRWNYKCFLNYIHILNVCVPKNSIIKYLRQKWVYLKEKGNESIITAEDVNLSLAVIDRSKGTKQARQMSRKSNSN